MTLFNGSQAYITCEEPSVTVAQGCGHCHSPYRTQDNLFPIRFHANVIELMGSASANNRRKGFKGMSGLTYLDKFDIVNGTVPDYMHAVLLGIVKTLMNKWFSASESGSDYLIGKELRRVFERLLKVKPPFYMEQLPRDLEKNYAHFKATEIQAFYYIMQYHAYMVFSITNTYSIFLYCLRLFSYFLEMKSQMLNWKDHEYYLISSTVSLPPCMGQGHVD